MYEASGSSIYQDFFMQRMEHIVSGDGSIFIQEPERQPGDRKIQITGMGRELLYMYALSGKEKYKKAIDHEIVSVRELSGEILSGRSKERAADFCKTCSEGNAAVHDRGQKPEEHAAVHDRGQELKEHAAAYAGGYGEETFGMSFGRQLYLTQPFYMEYETKYHNKAEYKMIVQLLSAIGQDVKADKDTGWYLMALTDVIGCMSIEIYEHYRFLEENLKRNVRRLIQDRDSLPKGGEHDFGMMLGTVILKACSQKNLNPEKYADAGLALVRERMNVLDFVKRKESVGLLMMAYAQLLQFGGGHAPA